jgi:hypothetical protein
MENKAKIRVSRELATIFFISILFIDWLYIFTIQQQAHIINHWAIALPIIIPLSFALTLLAVLGMLASNIRGYILAYFAIIMSMYFSTLSYDSMPIQDSANNLQFILLILLNVAVFIYLVFCNVYFSSNNRN